MIKNLNFDDVHLVPRVVSEIKSRDDIKIKINLGNLTLTSPIIASPMKDVCDGKVAKEMHRLGGLGIIHRFMSIEDQLKEYEEKGNVMKFVALGMINPVLVETNPSIPSVSKHFIDYPIQFKTTEDK